MHDYMKHSVSRSLLNLTHPHAENPLQDVEEFYFVTPTEFDGIMVEHHTISDLNQVTLNPVRLRHNSAVNDYTLLQENYNDVADRIASTLKNTMLNYEDKLFFNLLRYLTDCGICQCLNQNKKSLIELLHSIQNEKSLIRNVVICAKILNEERAAFTNFSSKILISKFCNEDELFLFFDDRVGCIIEETQLTLTTTKEISQRQVNFEAYESVHMAVTKPSKIMKIVVKTGELEKFIAIFDE